MLGSHSALGLVVLAACGGCSSAPSGSAVGAEGGDGGPFVVAAPWKATSARVELSSFGYFIGSMKYASDRAALSPAQLTALDGLRTRPDATIRGVQDLETFSVTVVDADGTRASYFAADRDLGGAPPAGQAGTLAKATLDPFLATFTCVRAREMSRCVTTVGGEATAECTANVGDDQGCLNGVFVSSDCADIAVPLTVSHAGPYEIATVDCIETVTVKLLSEAGDVVLATSPAGTKPACSSVTHTFDAPGTFRLLLEKRNASGCPGTSVVAGDFYLRVRPL